MASPTELALIPIEAGFVLRYGTRSMACFVYVLASAHGENVRTYVGWTTDLDRRLDQHNNGTGAKSTRGQQWVLLYAERYETEREAMSREWYLKRNRKLRRQLASEKS